MRSTQKHLVPASRQSISCSEFYLIFPDKKHRQLYDNQKRTNRLTVLTDWFSNQISTDEKFSGLHTDLSVFFFFNFLEQMDPRDLKSLGGVARSVRSNIPTLLSGNARACRGWSNATGIASRNEFAPTIAYYREEKGVSSICATRCITYVYSVSGSDYTACKAEKFLLFLEIPYRSSASERYHATKKLGTRFELLHRQDRLSFSLSLSFYDLCLSLS